MEHNGLNGCSCSYCVMSRHLAADLKARAEFLANIEETRQRSINSMSVQFFTHDYQEQYAEAEAANR